VMDFEQFYESKQRLDGRESYCIECKKKAA